MKILVTGSGGFIGKNLVAELNNLNEGKAKGYNLLPNIEVFQFERNSNLSDLERYCREAEFVFHLAGVNRPKEDSEFMEGNYGLTSLLLNTLKKYENYCPVLLASSIQAEKDNPYGKSKRAGEKLLINYGLDTGAEVLIYRYPNVFGKWCKPNYNSAVATFCYNISHGLPITVNDPSVMMTLVYIDDVVREMINALDGKPNKETQKVFQTTESGEKNHSKSGFYKVAVEHQIALGDIVDLIYSFKDSRNTLEIPDLSNAFIKKLYSTYLSYLPEDNFSYPLKMNVDDRGSFTEFLKTTNRGQVSINISKPGITKGEHWHHTKNEKFLVVSGTGVIRFRKIGDDRILEYFVSGDKLEVLDIPVGYTHNIENLGEDDMVTVMWVNEIFDCDNPDTYSEKVEQK